ncbi:MAG: UbiA family prenyltransferase, partial [Candidatus Zixiibacteriota bacterium]
MRRFWDIIRLIRAGNCLLAMAAVWVGAYLTWLDPVYYGPLVAGFAAFLVCAAGNVINDIVDIDIDRVNRPDRVLVRGDVSIPYARNLAILSGVIAIICGVAVNIEVTIAVVAAMVLLLLYNLWLKRVRVAGNFVIAL